MKKLKVTVIPVVIGALETIPPKKKIGKKYGRLGNKKTSGEHLSDQPEY